MPAPSNYNSPFIERVFVQNQGSTQASILLGASLAAAKLLRIPPNGIKLTPAMPITPVPWKTGTRSMQPGISGRQSATFELSNLPVIPSGTAGTVPDADAVYEGIFNQSATVVAATSATYSFLDSGIMPFTLASFPHGVPTLTQRLVFGCCPEQVSWQLNGNIFTQTVSGMGVYRLDSDNFTNEDTAQQGGYITYPDEPATPVIIGAEIPGFGGIATIDGVDMALQLRACTISCKTGNRLMPDLFGSPLPQFQVGGQREITASFGFVDNDGAALIALKNLSKSYGVTNVTITVGTVVGYQVVFTLKAVQLVVPDMTDETDFVTTAFAASAAHASAIANTDDMTLSFQ
jgi:hypothetical protein